MKTQIAQQLTIYTYAQHTTRAGQVCLDPAAEYGERAETTGDLNRHDDIREDLIAHCREVLSRPASAANAFRQREARAIMEHLDA